ncbi:carbohydrate ABC transporter permease [Arthrobacter glacialis]|uniref:Carbohydrate ABC transporter permease n=1 Tax=Arthrobacter glacialis TaxID=1664 RepID=A0A2S3ZV36_ARTGL|nr:carbohydrate ABC transporter permease [Arthrobacter glacialis]POH73121.1 carbohydrate ABC transporter permease [Arthrobacter glacialis]
MTVAIATRRNKIQKFRLNWAFVTTIVVTVVLLFPVYWMFLTAVLPTSAVLSRTPAVIPIGQPLSLDAVKGVLTETSILSWFARSAVVTIGASVLSAVLSIFAAFAMSRFILPGSKAVGFTLLMGRVLPGTLLALPFFVLFQTMGLLDTSTSVILANTAAITPFTALMMKSYFDGIPRELDEAAMVDGCSRLGALWRVLLPVSIPGVAACVGFAATSAWTDLLFSRTLLISQEQWTIPMGIASMIGDVNVNWNQLMAVGALSILPVLVVYWFLQPHLVSGMTAGGVKG